MPLKTCSTLLLYLAIGNLANQTHAMPNTQYGAGLRSLKLEARRTMRPSEALFGDGSNSLVTVQDEFDLDVRSLFLEIVVQT